MMRPEMHIATCSFADLFVQTFHNEESGDVIAWLTRGVPASGGSCVVAPVHSIYNQLAARRSDIIRTLAKSDWPIAL